MKRFVGKMALFIPIPLMMAVINYAVDPAHLFRGGAYESGIAQLLLRGHHVAGLSDYDDRLVQRYYVAGLTSPMEVIAVGSSRSMQISSSMFPGRAFFNHSVAGASLEDYLAVYGMYRQKGLVPTHVILGVDPWIFNRRRVETRWRSVGGEYREIALLLSAASGTWPKEARATVIPERYLELCSASYLQASASSWLNRLLYGESGWKPGGRIDYYPTQEPVDGGLTKLRDGSVVYDRRKRSMSVEDVHQEAITHASGNVAYSFGSFTRADPLAQRTFEAFLDLLEHDGVEALVFLSPYHPVTYERLMRSQAHRAVMAVEQYLERVADERRIRLVGSYNPRELELEEQAFLDGVHLKASAVERLFAGTPTMTLAER